MAPTPEHLLSRRWMYKKSHHRRCFLFLFQFSTCIIHYLSWHYERNSSFGRLWKIKGHQMKTKRSFIPMRILQTTTRQNCQGDTHLFAEPMLWGFFCSHAWAAADKKAMEGRTGTGLNVSSSVKKKEIFRKVLTSGGMGYWEPDQYFEMH